MAVVKQNTYAPGTNNDVTNVCQNVDLNRLGTDHSFITWSGTAFILEQGSIVEANGSLYAITADINLGNTSGYLIFNTTTLTFSISPVTRSGNYDPLKTGYYSAATTRILKWTCTAGGSYGIFQNNIGPNVDPTFGNGLSIGVKNVSIDDGAIAIGNDNSASGASSVAIGDSNSAGADGIAVGNRNLSGTGVTLGRDNVTSIGTKCSASGIANFANGSESSSFGYGNIVEAPGELRASAFGHGNTASNDDASSMGRANIASGESSSAHGRTNTASSLNTSAHGNGNLASNTNASAFGYSNTASNIATAAFGYDNDSTGYPSSAFGVSNLASAQFSSAHGFDNEASAVSASAHGSANVANGTGSSAIGNSNVSSGSDSSAFGSGLTTIGIKESAFGCGGSNIRIFNKLDTENNVFDTLEGLNSATDATIPAIITIATVITTPPKTVNLPVNGYCRRYSSGQWYLCRLDPTLATETIIKTFNNSVATAIGINFVLVDIAR